MPQKDKDEFREYQAEWHRDYRKKQKLMNSLTTPLIVWTKFAKKDDFTEVRLLIVEGQNVKHEFLLPVLSLESMIRTLKKYNFPDKVTVLEKKFIIKCVEIEED